MKRYLIDTTLLGAGLLRRAAALEVLTPWITHREAATSILVYGELIEHIRAGRLLHSTAANSVTFFEKLRPTSSPIASWSATPISDASFDRPGGQDLSGMLILSSLPPLWNAI